MYIAESVGTQTKGHECEIVGSVIRIVIRVGYAAATAVDVQVVARGRRTNGSTGSGVLIGGIGKSCAAVVLVIDDPLVAAAIRHGAAAVECEG